MLSIRTKSVCIWSLICIAGLTGQAFSSISYEYSGSLTGTNGLVATTPWNTASTVLSWEVTYDDSVSNLWHYSYSLVVPAKSISHIIIEASKGNEEGIGKFTSLNMSNIVGDEKVDTDPENIDIKIHSPLDGKGNTNPNMPEEMYGIKINALDGVGDVFTFTVSFDSDRAPVWGDFYAKDGNSGPVYLYNSGFTTKDPEDGPANGSKEGHLLVPDTLVVPEPGVLTLLCVGGLGFLLKRKR